MCGNLIAKYETQIGKTMRVLFLYLLVATLVSGCGEFSYKQGAGVRELDNARQTCRSADEASAEKCLEAHGWFVHKFEDPNSAITEELNQQEPTNAENTKAATADAVTDKNESSSKQISLQKSHSEPVELQNTQVAQTYKISSWWKMGANDSQLKMDLNQCSVNLANDDAANFVEQRYTKTFIQCMNKLGWRALGTTK